jgi:hypothetical protein
MRDYGKVYTAFWTSEDARGMSEDGRTLALYLMTCPHGNMLGCFRLTDAYAADDLQWKPERVRKGFEELFAKGFAYRCERTFWVLIRHYLKWNQFENPNVGLAAGKMFSSLNCPDMVKAALAAALRDFSPKFPAKILDAFESSPEPFENPFALSTKTRTKPEPKPEPEPEPKTLVELKPDTPFKVDPIQEVFDYWCKRMSSPGSKLDKSRRKLIENALKNYSPREICEAIKGCSLTPHNMGANENNQKYNGLNVILRNADQIDRFINTARAKPGAQVVGVPQTEEQYLADVQAALDKLNGHGGARADDDPNTIDMEQ